jgi:hypothetical protein
MGNLEECFFSEKGKTLLHPNDKDAQKVCSILRKGLRKEGTYVQRGGEFTRYTFNLDLIYNPSTQINLSAKNN